MLSIENPPRDPPSCPSQISQLKTCSTSSSNSDEKKASSDKQLQLVDLLKSDLDDNNHPLPKFSIRDYVFNTRSKDIKNNWPFSQEKLQLCLKHGVTDLLPPFQSPDTLRNPSLESCSSDNSLLSKKESLGNSNGDPSGRRDDIVFVDSENVGCSPKIAVDCLNANPSGSEGYKEILSTISSQSCSEIDSVAANKSPSLESETDILPELSVAKPEAISPASNKTENTTQAPAKKCRVIVKSSSFANQSTKEDTAANNFMVSEAMASKVCPVCKTFSSSSNTTLNAHIDQCLSGESTTKWSANSKVIKHRIKPRKMKSMVEIYATAPHCTLEELDRRNGTNWATNSILPAQGTEICADQNKQGSSHVDLEETANEGAVYIDANGTKLRILSKSNDPSLFSELVDGPRPKKLINRDKVSKILLAKKKKKQNQVQKQHKLLKHGKKIFASRLHHSSEINKNHDRIFSGEENHEKEKCMSLQFDPQAQVKFTSSDMIRGWVCSKRSGLTKKSNGRDDLQHSGNGGNGDFRVENDQLSLGNSHVKKSCIRRTPNIFENPLSSPKRSKQIDNSSRDPDDKVRGQPSLRKKMGFSSIESQSSHDRKRSWVFPGFPDQNIKRSRNDKAPNQEDRASLPSKRKVKMNGGLERNADHPVIDPKLSAGQHTLLSKARRFSSLRKKLSAGRASVPDSRIISKRKCSAFKKFRVHSISDSNEEAVSGLDRQNVKKNPCEDRGRRERTCDIKSVDRTGVLKVRKSGGDIMFSKKEEVVALKTSESVPMTCHRDAGDHEGSFMLDIVSASRSDVVESAGRNNHSREKYYNSETPSEVAAGGAFVGFRNSLDAGFHGLDGSSDARCDSRFNDVYKEPQLFDSEAPGTSAEPILSGGQEIFCAAEVPENMIRHSGHVMAELHYSDGHGNYFVEVDPIPIPGPPGSFLPSPGHMDSEDLQGNSSLTSSRVQSSDDHQELVDHSSESPISATSTISNSTLARSDLKSPGKLSVGCPHVLNEMRPHFIAAAYCDPIVENTSPVLKPTNAGVEKRSLDELKVNSTISERAAFRLKSSQPCCCSRKEVFSENVSLNFQEPVLLPRRTMAALVVPASGKEMSGDVDRRLDSLRSEMSSISGQSPGSKTATSSPMGIVPSRISSDYEVFPSRDDCESTSPPASIPVLRLMGKNLMVVNKDESVSQQLKPSQFSSMIGHANPHVLPISGVPVGYAQNEKQHVAHQVVSCLDRTESCKPAMQHSEIRWIDGFGNENHGTHQMSPFASPAMLSSRGAVRGFMGSFMHHQYIAGYNLPTEQRQPLNGLGSSVTCDIDKVVRSPSLRWRNANTTANTVTEVIVIDDTPETEVDSRTVPSHNEGMLQGMGSSSSAGKSITMTSACDSRHASTFHSYQQYESAPYSGSPVDASFWMPPSNGVNRSPVKRNWTAEGSNAPHPSPLTVRSSYSAQLGSKLHTSSSFQ